MHRLIVQLKEPLNASFCESVVNLFGECELIPLSEDYCVLEGLNLKDDAQNFEVLLQFIKTNANKAFLATLKSKMDYQFSILISSPKKVILSDFQLNNILLYNTHELKKDLWVTIPWIEPDF